MEAALASFSTAMTGWGRNLLSAGGVVDSFSSNEGIKALVSGACLGLSCFRFAQRHAVP